MRAPAYMPILIVVIGTLICIGIVAGVYFGVDMGLQARIDAANQKYNAAYEGSTQQAHDAADALFQKNTATANQIIADWHVKEQTLMPPYDVSQRDVAWKQLSYEFSEHLGPMVERWMSAQTDVKYNVQVGIEAPPPSPNGITGDTLVIPVTSGGSITAMGDFRSLLTSVLKWNDFNRLALIDNLNLTGNSPRMQATYTLRLIIFPQNADKLGSTIAKNGTGAASGGGGYGAPSGFSGGGGGMPSAGMPPGVIPGR